MILQSRRIRKAPRIASARVLAAQRLGVSTCPKARESRRGSGASGIDEEDHDVRVDLRNGAQLEIRLPLARLRKSTLNFAGCVEP